MSVTVFLFVHLQPQICNISVEIIIPQHNNTLTQLKKRLKLINANDCCEFLLSTLPQMNDDCVSQALMDVANLHIKHRRILLYFRVQAKSDGLVQIYYSALNFKNVILATGKVAANIFVTDALNQVRTQRHFCPNSVVILHSDNFHNFSSLSINLV
jgi:hypothetical protein